MAFIKLYDDVSFDAYQGGAGRPRLLIFTEGTILGPEHWWGWFNDKGYAPIGQAVGKIKAWCQQGARVAYLTSRKKPADVAAIREILRRNQFPGVFLFYREGKERYADIAEQVKPDVLLEDDCRSIGGRWQMSITYVREDVKQNIHSVVIREFAGIDYLPDDLWGLLTWLRDTKVNDV